MRYLPLFRDVKDRDCLVVGGGAIAFRKAQMLRRAEARITIVAPTIAQDFSVLAETGGIELQRRRFKPDDVAGKVMVVAATGDKSVNRAVAYSARSCELPVNVVDDASLSDIIIPAIVDRDPLVVAISTGGGAPVLARRIRAAIEAMLPASLGTLVEDAAALRPRVRLRLQDAAHRLRFWERYFAGWRSGQAGPATPTC